MITIQALAMPVALQVRLLQVALAGLVALSAWGLLARTGVGRLLSSPRHRAAGLCGAAALGLAVAGGAAYARQWSQTAYLEVHHLVGLPPLLILALAGLAGQLLPGRPRWLPMLGSAAALLPWLQQVRIAQDHSDVRDGGRYMRAELLDAARLADPINAAARAAGRAPVVVSWLPPEPDERLQTRTEVVAELAHWGLRTEGLPSDCWLVTLEGALPMPADHVVGGYAAVHDPDCGWLPALAKELCSRPEGEGVLRRRMPETRQVEDRVKRAFPCATSLRERRR